MDHPSKTPGICRIDQPSHRTHGFFVRMQRRGKMYSAFFTDLKHGGRKQALAAAQAHYRKLAAKLGTPMRKSRRFWAECEGLFISTPPRTRFLARGSGT